MVRTGIEDMLKTLLATAVVAMTAFTGANPAAAAGPGGFARNLRDTPTVSFIAARTPTLAPFAHVKFCMQNPAECKKSSGSSVIAMTSYRENQLKRVNSSVNRSVRAVNDSSATDGGDVWQVSGGSGDCEDFALIKRKRLIAMGWSPRALRIAVARTGSGEGHAVLVVKTSRGDLVLDNRTAAIRNWKNTDLRWVKIQSGDNPRIWYNI